MRVLISAGEASGENYGAMLIPVLREIFGAQTEFFGVGGERMRAAGCEIIVDSKSVAVIGITEVIKHIPKIYREFYRMVAEAKRRSPDVALLIDFPDFNLRLAQQLHKLGVPVVYFVSPQLWAWKKRRIRRVQRFVERMLVIFPFEESYYRERGVPAEYVGHPLADLPLPLTSREELAQRLGLDPQKQWIALLPGSRRREVLLNLPIMLQAAAELGGNYEFLLPVASTLTREWMTARTANSAVPIHLLDDARLAMFHARASIVASGTATVEAALIGNPFIVVYRLSWLSYEIGRRFVRLSNYAMVNLIAGREIVPELIQQRFTAKNVVTQMSRLLKDGAERETMLQELKEVRQKLHLADPTRDDTAIKRAALAVAAVAMTAKSD
ncbi:MAG TPA: lipid-A-disaccharide synthase [Terriglobales bacterium]